MSAFRSFYRHSAGKPAGASGLDWGSGLTEDLWLATVPQVSPIDELTDRTLTLDGTIPLEIGERGPSARFTDNNSDDSLDVDKQIDSTPEGTIFVAIDVLSTANAPRYIFRHNDYPNGHRIYFYARNSKVGIRLGTGSDSVAGSSIATAKTIAVTWAGGNADIYIDGVYDRSYSYTGTPGSLTAGAPTAWGNPEHNLPPCEMRLYAGYVWKRELSATEIERLAQSPYSVLRPRQTWVPAVVAGGTTFDVSLSLARSAATSPSAEATIGVSLTTAINKAVSNSVEGTFDASTPMGRTDAITTTGGLSFEDSVSIGRTNTTSSQVDVAFETAFSLARSIALAEDMLGEYAGAVSLSKTNTITTSNISSIAGNTLLGKTNAVLQTFDSFFEESLSLSRSAFATSDAEATIEGGVGLDKTNSVFPQAAVSFEGTVTVSVSKAVSQLSEVGEIDVSTVVGKTLGILATTSDGVFESSVAVAKSLSAQQDTTNSIADAISLASEQGITSAVEAVVEGSVIVTADKGFGATVQGDYGPSLTLSQTIGINTVARLLAEAGLTMGKVVDVVAVGTKVTAVLILPSGRTLVVSVDDRTLSVSSEDRTLTIN